MKTTLDLPEPLVREMKLRAAQEGRKLKDVATEVFEAGLRAPAPKGGAKTYSQKLDTSLFACEAAKVEASSMKVADLLRLEQRAQSEEDASRAGQAL
ncbi:MAG: antitoxin [Verrucomicrobiota bacterium]